jgi:hypothetical protein
LGEQSPLISPQSESNFTSQHKSKSFTYRHFMHEWALPEQTT